MLVRQRQAAGRILPHGPIDLLRQIALFAAAYYLYRLTRGIADNPGVATTAFNHARDLISIERSLNVFIEPSVQTFVSGERWLADIASWMYINAQTSITLGALAWIYLRRNPSFYFVRNMFLVAFLIALIGYTVFPTAPPRFLPEWGFIDTVAQFTGVPQDSVTVDALFNPYAAVPSMHAGFAIMIGWPLARLVKPRALRVFWASYPLIVTFVIVATANHFLADAFLGACTAGLGALAARWLARVRPAAWSFRAGAKQAAPA
jgi:PAP2 superfamily